MLNRREEYLKMARAELDHWWYRGLHHLAAVALATHPRGRAARVVDAGCGTGGLLLFLQRLGYQQLAGFDASAEAVQICRDRGLPVARHDLRELDQAVGPESADVIVSNDTLYFFPPTEQARILRLAWTALAPGGLVLLNLPALTAFRGIHDLSVGIPHRINKAEALRLLAAGPFECRQACYWPFLLSPFIFWARAWQRWRLRRMPPPEIKSDLDLPPSVLNKILEQVVRYENAWLPWKPFGSSLFLVGRKERDA